jgi:phage gp37-like protein
MYSVEDIEDEIIVKLKDSDLLLAACPTIETYGGQLDSLTEEIPALSIDLPAVLILYSGSKFSEPANRSFDEEPAFSAVIIGKNLRGPADLRTGAYEILDLVRSVLIDNNLGLDIEPIHPLSVEAIWISREMAVYGFDFKTSQSLD